MKNFQTKSVAQTMSKSSGTAFESDTEVKVYTWDTSAHAPKEDPFFATPNIVIDAPSVEIETDSEQKVHISY